jgi:hypothetical protein
MARFLMDSEPVEILALGSCQIDPAIKDLEGPEAFDTATILMKFANGKDAVIDVCRQAPYGYDQRAEVLGKKAMIQTDNNYPNTARIYKAEFTGNADMPYDFFMSRYKEAYVKETLAFVEALVNKKPAPCTGEDGLVALVMSIAAGISADEKRWVKFSELAEDLCSGVGADFNAKSAEDAIVDKVTGALKFEALTNPKTGLISAKKNTPAALFERIAGRVWVPPSRPDLKKKLSRK